MLKEGFELVDAELIPIRIIPEITDIPHIWRYFVRPLNSVLARLQLDEKEFVARTVMDINTKLKGAYVFSSGKNMGTFKAVGYPRMWDASTGWRNMRDTAGRPMGAIPPIPRLVGRRAPLFPAGLVHRPQRRDILLRRQPALY